MVSRARGHNAKTVFLQEKVVCIEAACGVEVVEYIAEKICRHEPVEGGDLCDVPLHVGRSVRLRCSTLREPFSRTEQADDTVGDFLDECGRRGVCNAVCCRQS